MPEINEADVLRQMNLEDLGRSADVVYKDFITEVADELIQQFRDKIQDNTKGSGTLAQSVSPLIKKDGFVIEADYYYRFVDDGVNAAPKQQGLKYTRPLVQNSPYSFKHLGVGSNMERSIAQWSGVSIGQAYGIAISIKKHGIKAKGITDSVITNEVLEKISTDLGKVTGFIINATFKKHGAK